MPTPPASPRPTETPPSPCDPGYPPSSRAPPTVEKTTDTLGAGRVRETRILNPGLGTRCFSGAPPGEDGSSGGVVRGGTVPGTPGARSGGRGDGIIAPTSMLGPCGSRGSTPGWVGADPQGRQAEAAAAAASHTSPATSRGREPGRREAPVPGETLCGTRSLLRNMHASSSHATGGRWSRVWAVHSVDRATGSGTRWQARVQASCSTPLARGGHEGSIACGRRRSDEGAIICRGDAGCESAQK